MKMRVGDTLIEVAIAVAIFSMVAISIVAVTSSSSSNSETALEITLAREEIDTQAEALRFIHDAYLASMESGIENSYTTLWNNIIKKAINPDPDRGSDYQTYTPKTCQEVYDNNPFKDYGFVINPRALSTGDAYINDKSKLVATVTYPRLVYTQDEVNHNDGMIDQSAPSTNLYRAEGIFVIAVKDPNTTQIVDGNSASAGSGYYDFYIRTCWYGVGSNTPSTISTVIRLYNPSELAN